MLDSCQQKWQIRADVICQVVIPQTGFQSPKGRHRQKIPNAKVPSKPSSSSSERAHIRVLGRVGWNPAASPTVAHGRVSSITSGLLLLFPARSLQFGPSRLAAESSRLRWKLTIRIPTILFEPRPGFGRRDGPRAGFLEALVSADIMP